MHRVFPEPNDGAIGVQHAACHRQAAIILLSFYQIIFQKFSASPSYNLAL